MQSSHLIFFGSDQYSEVVLSHLLTANSMQLTAIITDKHNDGSPVEKLAIAHNLKVSYYPDFDHSLITNNTLGLCASFDHLIPQDIIKLFGGNLYNLHPSLLPQYRNVSPVQYAITMGDTITGITLFRISEGIDNGEIIAQASKPILPTDTTPTLTPRLFKLGAELFIKHLIWPSGPGLAGRLIGPARPGPMDTLIFTKRLTRDSGYIEWSVLHKLLQNESISPSDTVNELLKLRLNKDKVHNLKIVNCKLILEDLLRSLTPWPGVWSNVPTKKGDLRISIPLIIPHTSYNILISGKPNPIAYSDFAKYYL